MPQTEQQSLIPQRPLMGESWDSYYRSVLDAPVEDWAVIEQLNGFLRMRERARFTALGSRGPVGGGRDTSRAWHDEALFENFQAGAESFVPSIRIGYAKKAETAGQFLFRRVVVGSPTFKYRKSHLERFERSDTRRPMNAPFRYKRRQFETLTGSLERRGFASMLDRDELAAADAANAILGPGGIDVRAMHALLARDEVENDLEFVRATIATAAASYSASAPDLDVTLTTEWDAVGGDARADIQAQAQILAMHHGVSTRDIGVMLTDASERAALNDPTYITKLQAINTIDFPTTDRLAAYWGVGEVVTRDAYYTTDGVALTSMWGEVAILYVMPSRLQGFDTRETSFDSFVDFSWNPAGGLAMAPVYKGAEVEGLATSWIFPWESWVNPQNVSTVGAAIIRNTAS